MNIHYTQIRKTISTLAARRDGFQVFGAKEHQFKLHPVLTEQEIQEFEHKHQISLPEEYRDFLLQVGNGGAGPAYGLFKLGEMDNGWRYAKWKENNGFVGILALPFPHTEAWNDLQGEPDYDLEDEDELERQVTAFEANYFNPNQVNGAIPICHLGCAFRQWLIISGPERGNVWCDDRTDHKGLYPLQKDGKPRMKFIDWYLTWLNEVTDEINFGNKGSNHN